MKTRGKKVKITCKCGCGHSKLVRTADVKRGWGKFYSKQCKGFYQGAKNRTWKAMISDVKSK